MMAPAHQSLFFFFFPSRHHSPFLSVVIIDPCEARFKGYLKIVVCDAKT